MATESEAFCSRFFLNESKDRLLVLAGDPGCGKTHTAKAIHKWSSRASIGAWQAGAWDDVPSTAFVNFSDIASELRQRDTSSVVDMKSVDLLVLDDIGSEVDPFRDVAMVLCQVLNARAKKFTVVTTNIEQAKWSECYDRRISDRLLRNSVVVDLFGIPSYAELEVE